MSEIPNDVKEAANRVYLEMDERLFEWSDDGGIRFEQADVEAFIARAILAERERCARLIEEGFVRPVATPYADKPGFPSKNDKCPHDRYMYEDCEQCCAAAIRDGQTPYPFSFAFPEIFSRVDK